MLLWTREEKANAAHDVWCHWMKYMFSQCERLPDGREVIPADKARRWIRQMCMEYEDLPDREKASDRAIADRFLRSDNA